MGLLKNVTDALCRCCRKERASAAVMVVSIMLLVSPRVGERQLGSDTRAIAALKVIAVAEISFAAVYGHFDTLDCLGQFRCVPNSPGHDEPFLSPHVAADAARYGYRFEFSPGPSAWDPSVPTRSKSAVVRFAVAAVPTDIGSVPRRAFCIDDIGTVYVSPAGTRPRVENGRCVDVENPVR
jgi:hypothetical protein